MPVVTVSLPEDVYEMVRETMEKEKMGRSKAIAYLIRMGYIYRYKVLPEFVGKGSEE
jgi:metal-responsive CopG/Arc/MetJ family transcriptional regulator